MWQEKPNGACRQKWLPKPMIKPKEKMQIAATIIFLMIFIVLLICDISINGADAHCEDLARSQTEYEETKPPDKVETELQTETEGVTTLATEEQEKIKKQYVYYNVPLDDSTQEYIQDTCDEYGLDRYDIVIALIEKESTFRENVISSTNDYGYMQINECNHEWLSEELSINDFLDGKQNILAGVYVLSGLYEKYEDIGLALMAYNCGERGAKKLWEQGIYSTEYSRAIMEIAEGLQPK